MDYYPVLDPRYPAMYALVLAAHWDDDGTALIAELDPLLLGIQRPLQEGQQWWAFIEGVRGPTRDEPADTHPISDLGEFPTAQDALAAVVAFAAELLTLEQRGEDQISYAARQAELAWQEEQDRLAAEWRREQLGVLEEPYDSRAVSGSPFTRSRYS